MNKETKILMYLAAALGAFFMFKDQIMSLIGGISGKPNVDDSIKEQMEGMDGISLSTDEEIEEEVAKPKEDLNKLVVYGETSPLVTTLQKHFNTILHYMTKIKKDTNVFNALSKYNKDRINAVTKIKFLVSDGNLGAKSKEAFTICFGPKNTWNKKNTLYKVKYWKDLNNKKASFGGGGNFVLPSAVTENDYLFPIEESTIGGSW